MLIGLFAINNINGIGNNGSMPWPANKDDLRWFKKNTMNNIVVMGRLTWDSSDMPSPLPNRLNVVFTNKHIDNDDILQYRGDVITPLMELSAIYPEKNIYIIGGSRILKQAQPVLEKLLITRIDDNTECDTTLDLSDFLIGFKHANTIKTGECKIEEWVRCKII